MSCLRCLFCSRGCPLLPDLRTGYGQAPLSTSRTAPHDSKTALTDLRNTMKTAPHEPCPSRDFAVIAGMVSDGIYRLSLRVGLWGVWASPGTFRVTQVLNPRHPPFPDSPTKTNPRQWPRVPRVCRCFVVICARTKFTMRFKTKPRVHQPHCNS